MASALAALALVVGAQEPTSVGWTVPEGAARARTLFVIDGDTIGVLLDGAVERVRYAGIDAPELGETPQAYALEARAANEALVQGQHVALVWAEEPVDRYGRRLAYVFTPEGVFVNAWLIEHGYARRLVIPPNVRFADFFRALEEAARESERGIWSH